MTKTPDPIQHPVDRYLERAPDTKAIAQMRREHKLDALDQLARSLANNLNAPLPLIVTTELSDRLNIYLYAHNRADGLNEHIPEHLAKFAELARNHVAGGGEFCLDHALDLIDPPFKGPKPKGPGEHKHRRLFLVAFYDLEVGGEAKTQIGALRRAAEQVGLIGYEEKTLDGEYRDWCNANSTWLIWVFDMA